MGKIVRFSLTLFFKKLGTNMNCLLTSLIQARAGFWIGDDDDDILKRHINYNSGLYTLYEFEK